MEIQTVAAFLTIIRRYCTPTFLRNRKWKSENLKYKETIDKKEIADMQDNHISEFPRNKQPISEKEGQRHVDKLLKIP